MNHALHVHVYCSLYLHTHILVDDRVFGNRFDDLPEVAALSRFVDWTHCLHHHLQVYIILLIIVLIITWILSLPVIKQHDVLVRQILDGFLQFVLVHSILLPTVLVSDVKSFSLEIAAVNRTFGHLQIAESLDEHARDSFGVPQFAYILQVAEREFQGTHEIGDVHGILTCLVQEKAQIERLVVAVCVVVAVRRADVL